MELIIYLVFMQSSNLNYYCSTYTALEYEEKSECLGEYDKLKSVIVKGGE